MREGLHSILLPWKPLFYSWTKILPLGAHFLGFQPDLKDANVKILELLPALQLSFKPRDYLCGKKLRHVDQDLTH